MKKGLSGFFKSPAFARSFFVFGAAFFATLAISCRQLASFHPVVNGGYQTTGSGGSGGTSSEPTEFSFDLKATHGLRQKISLEWNSFSGASYYEIYFAESSSAEFVQIGESHTNSFEDTVSAGRTGYFRVRAVKPNGASSPFSSTVVGTSLAMPIISGGEVDSFAATVTWSMGNARGIDGTDYYESSLIFEVVCQSKDGVDSYPKVFSAVDFAGSSYSCKFESLSSSRDYEFYVKAYLEGDAESFEQSPTVDKTTLTAYTPLAPKFTASEGDSAKGISLLITLPEMVTVTTYLKDSENSKEMQDVLYPLFFEVYRKHESDPSYSTNCTVLYYGKDDFTTSPVEYDEDGKPYEAGKQVVWFDEDPSLVGGEKYDYMILSYADLNYSKVVCPEDKLYNTVTPTPKNMATTARGWKSAHPSFNVEISKRELSADEKEVVSVSVGFSAKWNDLGKAENYKFAIKRFHTPFNGTSSSEPSWLKNGETIYFDTLSEVKSKVETFGSKNGRLSDAEQGTYSYTLYIVAKIDNGTEDIGDTNNILDSMDAIDRVVVTKEVNIPKSVLAVQDGYKDRVHLVISEFEKNEKDVTYSVERATLEDGKADEKSVVTIELSAPESGSFVYDDTTVQPNCTYSYVLKASATSGVFSLSTAQTAETLGTPSVTFRTEYFAYDSISISFDKVLAAKNYVVTLGENGGFGGGAEYPLDAENATSTNKNMTISLAGNTYNVTIEKPTGYDDARLAGAIAKLTVTAKSSVDSAASVDENVNVVGPAPLATRANTSAEAQDDSISLSWNKVEGAKGYLIKRVMYSDTAMKEVAEASDVTYYCDSSTNMVTLVDGSALGGRASVSNEDGKFSLIDTYKEKDTDDADLAIYQDAQSKIPWGLPFRYVVLPVLDKGDFEFGDESLALASGGKVAYSNFEKTQTQGTATCGYGLNPVAEKAMSGNAQGLMWEKPYNADLRPVVYRREAGSGGSFDLFYENNSLNGKDSANLTIEAKDNFYGAFEYIVKYCSKDPSLNFDVPPSLLKEIAKNKQSYETPNGNKEEQDNKGYLLTLENFDAKVHPNTDYYEQISWKNWDYNTRAVGPDYMVIKVQNNNIDATYHEIVKITNANANNGTEAYETSNGVANDVTAKAEAQATIAVAPKSIVEGSAGTTNGMLKVLRDYKHNYTIELHRARKEFDRQDLDGEDDGISVGSEEYADVITAYRQITDEELIKATMLILADIVKDSKMENATTGTGTLGVGAWERAVDGVTGYVDWWQNSTSRFRWRMSNYKHKWLTIPSNALQNANAFITLNDDYNNNNKGKKSSGSLQYLFNSGNSGTTDIGGSNSFDSSKLIPIYITGDEGLPDCYSGTLEFAAQKQYIKVKLSRNNAETFATKEFSGTNANYWCPINLDGNGYLGQNSDYGWW